MKKFFLFVGIMLVLGSLTGLFFVYVQPRQTEAAAVEEIREKVAEATEAAATEIPESDTMEEETHLYPWLNTATTNFQGQEIEWGVSLAGDNYRGCFL